jgi:transcriptional regulator with XRE-family HTH domain
MKERTFSGTNLQRLRKVAGFTQEELAAVSGFAASTIRNYESGRSAPQADRLAKLALHLGVHTDALYERGAR